MKFQYYICDVFTGRQFGGNPLAVLPDATGLDAGAMQQVAREFNFSESTFVFPAEAGNTRRVRIFTPAREVPFAGHPNVGTAFVLARSGALGPPGGTADIVFEEEAGLVPVRVTWAAGGRITCEVSAPEKLSIGTEVPTDALAAALSIEPDDISTAVHPPVVASVGLPFVVAELGSPGALRRCRPERSGFRAIEQTGVTPDVHVYTRGSSPSELSARMFAPLDGVPEDPATGSANCALAGLLAHHDDRASSGEYAWTVTQGVEMGRPSVLRTRATKLRGEVTGTSVAGECAMFSEGTLEIP